MKAAVGEVKCRRYNSLRLPHYGLRTGSEARALTLAFTTFVLFLLQLHADAAGADETHDGG